LSLLNNIAKTAAKFALEAHKFYCFDNSGHFELIETKLFFLKKSKRTAL